MSSTRVWILVLGVVCFLSGLATGVIYSEQTRQQPSLEGPFSDYCELISTRFDLDSQRRELFEALLQHYEEDLQKIQDQHAANYATAMEPVLSELGIRYRDLIRDHVLPENRRSEFVALCDDFADYTPE